LPADFTAYVRGIDVPGNKNREDAEIPVPGNPGAPTFTIDHHKPISAASAPVTGAFLNSPLERIYGTAIDQGGSASGLITVKTRVSRKNIDDNIEYWDVGFNTWTVTVPAQQWKLTSLVGGDWSVDHTGLQAWADGFLYAIQSYATDAALNNEVAYTTVTFLTPGQLTGIGVSTCTEVSPPVAKRETSAIVRPQA